MPRGTRTLNLVHGQRQKQISRFRRSWFPHFPNLEMWGIHHFPLYPTTRVPIFTRRRSRPPIDRPSWICRVILFLTLGLCVVLSGCKKDPPVSSAASKSPDGKLVATEYTFANSGFGGGPPTTFVYLSGVAGSQSPMLILSLTGGSDVAVLANVEMKWLNSTHLELKYKENQSVDFQAIKWGNVDISLRYGGSEPPQAGSGHVRNESQSHQNSLRPQTNAPGSKPTDPHPYVHLLPATAYAALFPDSRASTVSSFSIDEKRWKTS